MYVSLEMGGSSVGWKKHIYCIPNVDNFVVEKCVRWAPSNPNRLLVDIMPSSNRFDVTHGPHGFGTTQPTTWGGWGCPQSAPGPLHHHHGGWDSGVAGGAKMCPQKAMNQWVPVGNGV